MQPLTRRPGCVCSNRPTCKSSLSTQNGCWWSVPGVPLRPCTQRPDASSCTCTPNLCMDHMCRNLQGDIYILLEPQPVVYLECVDQLRTCVRGPVLAGRCEQRNCCRNGRNVAAAHLRTHQSHRRTLLPDLCHFLRSREGYEPRTLVAATHVDVAHESTYEYRSSYSQSTYSYHRAVKCLINNVKSQRVRAGGTTPRLLDSVCCCVARECGGGYAYGMAPFWMVWHFVLLAVTATAVGLAPGAHDRDDGTFKMVAGVTV